MKYIFFFLLLVPIASAHLEGGTDMVKDGYVLDMGYDPAQPIAKEKTVLSFDLYDEETDEPEYPKDVWVRISFQDEIMFSGTIASPSGVALFTTTFPEGGEYEITARYNLDDTTIQTNFILDVEGGSQLKGMVGILFLAVAIVLLWKSRKK